MKDSKLWRTFCLLSRIERNRFRKVLESPCYNKNEAMVPLLDTLETLEHPNMELLWKRLFPGEAYQQARLHHLLSGFLKLLQQFLARHQRYASKANERLDIAQALTSRKAEGLARSALAQASKFLEKEPLRNEAYHFRKYQIARSQQTIEGGLGLRLNSANESTADALDHWFVLQKLQQACFVLTQSQVAVRDMTPRFLEPVLQCIQDEGLERIPAISTYYRAYRLLTVEDGNEDHALLKERLEHHGALFSHEENRALHLILLNHCIQQLNRGQADYLPEIWRLYQLGLKDEWLLANGELSPYTFKNIVSAGLRLLHFGDVGQFIEDYQQLLPALQRVNFRQLAEAELAFVKGEYGDAQRALRYVAFKDPLADLRVRILQVKISIARGDMDGAETLLDRIPRLLRGKKLAYHAGHYRNFIRFTRQIMRLPPDLRKQALELRQSIGETKDLVEKAWLLEQVGQGASKL